MASKNYDFGRVECTQTPQGISGKFRVIGEPKTHPRFVNSIEGECWDSLWSKEASSEGINYIGHGNVAGGWMEGWGKSLDIIHGKMSGMIKRYNATAVKYNEEIATPAEEDRGSRLSKILEDVDMEISSLC